MSLESPDTLPAPTPIAPTGGAWPRRFGPYLLLDRIGRGGMGDVFLAKSGVAGIEKICVVKKIRSTFTTNREYVARFIDEARTVVQLMHRNVCQVFDVGAVDGAYYLAMELVPGKNLRMIQERAQGFSIAIPLPIVLHVLGEILEALDYAHRLTNPANEQPLGVVHRDVSPQNVIVSYEGEVKLIDFGLAASATKLEQTEPGIVLGKLQYMSPEQARGEVVDRRSDVFAVGVLLYEMLAGERYYQDLPIDAIWKLAESGGHHPAQVAKLTPALRSLIETATAAAVRDRFSSCAVFRQALRDAQLTEKALGSTAEAREFMQTLFPGEEADDRRERARLAGLPEHNPDAASLPSESVRFAVAPGPDTSRVRRLSSTSEDGPPTEPQQRPRSPLFADNDETIPAQRAPGPEESSRSSRERIEHVEVTEHITRAHGPRNTLGDTARLTPISLRKPRWPVVVVVAIVALAVACFIAARLLLP